MVSWEEVAQRALALPEVTEESSYGRPAWKVRGRPFAWERPLGTADVRRLEGHAPPVGPILAVAAEDLGEKEAVLEAHPESCFTIAHFDGYPAVLVLLEVVERDVLAELLVDAWLAKAPKPLAAKFLAERDC